MNHVEETTRDFLRDHPEHIVGVRWRPIEDGSEPELVMDTETLIAFTDWTIATGRGDAAKAKRFRQQLRERFGK